MATPSAYLLVAHGSRDPRSRLALEHLAQQFIEGLTRRQGPDAADGPVVRTGTLEFGSMSLDEQILDLGTALHQQGGSQLTILPLFLMAGNHVRVDIPAAVAVAQAQLGDQVQVQVQSHLGTHPQMVKVLQQHMVDRSDHPWILMAHGSTRPGGNQAVEALAVQLGALPAYWAGGPDLVTRIQEVMATQPEQIGILPYFLFAGRITDAIQQQVLQLQSKFNQLRFICTPPLEANHEMARLLLDLI